MAVRAVGDVAVARLRGGFVIDIVDCDLCRSVEHFADIDCESTDRTFRSLRVVFHSLCAGRGKLHIFCHADRERGFHKKSRKTTRDDRYDALVQKDRSHRLSIRFLMFDSCLLFVSPDSDLCV